MQVFHVVFRAMFPSSDDNDSETWYLSQGCPVEISKNYQMYYQNWNLSVIRSRPVQTQTDFEAQQIEENTWYIIQMQHVCTAQFDVSI